jgi:hypothetical protein
MHYIHLYLVIKITGLLYTSVFRFFHFLFAEVWSIYTASEVFDTYACGKCSL